MHFKFTIISLWHGEILEDMWHRSKIVIFFSVNDESYFLIQWYREKNTALMREAVHLRYSLLPYYYTLFKEASVSGIPVMRPLWLEFPDDKETFNNGDAFMVGPSILVQGIYQEVFHIIHFYCTPHHVSLALTVQKSEFLFWVCFAWQKQKSVSVYLPAKESWYNLRNGLSYAGGVTRKLEVLEDSIPSFQRAGTIIPRKDRFRRSSTQMVNDPYTLVCSFYASGASFSCYCISLMFTSTSSSWMFYTCVNLLVKMRDSDMQAIFNHSKFGVPHSCFEVSCIL